MRDVKNLVIVERTILDQTNKFAGKQYGEFLYSYKEDNDDYYGGIAITDVYVGA